MKAAARLVVLCRGRLSPPNPGACERQIGVQLRDQAPTYPEIQVIRVCALDQGVVFMESTNGYVQRLVAVAEDAGVTRALGTTVKGHPERVDPAKALFLFLYRLWTDLQSHKLHPGFDIRSYMSTILGTVIEAGGAGSRKILRC
jgi:hypothetical protein